MKSKIIHTLAYIVIAGNIFIIGLLIYWMLQPYNLPYVEQPIPVLNEDKVVKVGDPIILRLDIIKTHDLESIGSEPRIECKSGNLVTLVGNPVQLPVGDYELISDRFILPPKVLNNDLCKFVFRTTFSVNPIKSKTTEWFSEIFTVKE